MRFQPVSYLKLSLSLPIALFATHGVHAQGAHVDADALPDGDGRTARASGSGRLAHVSANL